MADYNLQNDRDTVAALLTLFEMQTEDEQQSQTTVHLNSVGFNAVDSGILTSISKQIVEKGFVTAAQIRLIRKKLYKYQNQLRALPSFVHPAIDGLRFVDREKPKFKGKLITDGDYLWFKPQIYPSSTIKNLGNFSWDGINGWKSRVNVPLVQSVREYFDPVELDPSVIRYLEEQDQPQELSNRLENSILFQGQKRTTANLLKCRRGMAALRPGLGKTASAIFAANELDRKKYDSILVVCPLTLTQNWKNEIKKWIDERAVIWHGSIEGWDNYDRWVITNYETIVRNTKDILNQEFTVIIFDETILLKNRKAKRTLASKQISKGVDYVWLLSGSPTSKFLDDMWSQLNIIDPRRFSSYWRFARQYCELEVNQWGTAISSNKDDALEKIQRDLSDIYFTADESEFPIIPDWIFDTIEVPMSEKQYKLYKQMEDDFLAILPEGDEVLAPNILAQMVRLQQFASNPLLLEGPDEGAKWKAVEDMLEYEIGPFIIWTQFKRTAELMRQRLERKYRVEMLTGETPVKDRQPIVDRMQNGDLDILIAHPAVGKFGLTLTKARTAIYMERSYNGDDYYQSLFRIRRISTTIPPHVIHILASRPGGNEMTIDHVIDRVLQYRKDNSMQVTSGMISRFLGKPNE